MCVNAVMGIKMKRSRFAAGELMRKGTSPTDACLEALRRAVHNYSFDESRLKMFDLQYYVLKASTAPTALWSSTPSGRAISYTVHDGKQAKRMPFTPLFQGIGDDYSGDARG
jgi:hypothetical protein